MKTIFIHIPKTAGMSLAEIVREAYPRNGCVFIYSHTDAYIDSLRERVRQSAALYGHFSFGIHDLFGVQARYVTVLRNPVDRVMSFFRHQANHNDNEYHARIARGMTLREFLRNEECHQLNNHMVRVLTAYPDERTTNDPALLEQAKSNLDRHFVAVGITERMDESVRLIGRTLGWRRVRSTPRINVDRQAGAARPDDETLAEIVRYNALDIELYDAVARTFPMEDARSSSA